MKKNKTYNYVRRFMYCLALIVITNVVWQCGAQKRLDRLVKRHPELIVKDTAIVHDTFIIDNFIVDTTFIKNNTVIHDTVVFTKDKIQIKYYNYHDTIFISGKYLGDTIVKIIKVPYDKIVVNQKPTPTWYWVVLALLCGSVATLIFIFINRKNKKDV